MLAWGLWCLFWSGRSLVLTESERRLPGSKMKSLRCFVMFLQSHMRILWLWGRWVEAESGHAALLPAQPTVISVFWHLESRG